MIVGRTTRCNNFLRFIFDNGIQHPGFRPKRGGHRPSDRHRPRRDAERQRRIDKSRDAGQVTGSHQHGRYLHFSPVLPGVYTVSAATRGFNTSRIDSVTLEIGPSKTLDITLTPANVEESMAVTSKAPLVTTNRANRGTV